jgi:hypothetical protein
MSLFAGRLSVSTATDKLSFPAAFFTSLDPDDPEHEIQAASARPRSEI